jgi:hypothetical protein
MFHLSFFPPLNIKIPLPGSNWEGMGDFDPEGSLGGHMLLLLEGKKEIKNKIRRMIFYDYFFYGHKLSRNSGNRNSSTSPFSHLVFFLDKLKST